MTQALENPRPRLHAVGSRVPPHDLDAEESLLGAMLLSRDAIAAALESCVAEDFYKPAHGHIFGAITALYTRGEAADPVTVADELRRAGLLDAVGDASVLTSLQVNTPSTANASHYARIVEEHALLRRLVAVAGEIAELGYSLPDDVSEVVDRAEAMVFDVAQRRIVDTMSPLRELLAQSLDHLENLYNRGDTITGVPTGYTDLDEQLAGLQKSNLVVVGARPAMGKALALDTPLPTPTGWTTMGEVAVGDEVFDEKGHVCRVEYTSPVFVGHRCYEVRFDDDSTLVADAGHRWLAYDHSQRVRLPGVVTTEEMLAEGLRHGDQLNWHLPVAEPFDGPEPELPVDPYVLGRWLAGHTRTGVPGMTMGGDHDAKHIRDEFESRGYLVAKRLSHELEAAGLAGAALHIPMPYLRTSFKQRLELLQGLMDTAGTVTNANGTVEICLSDLGLLEQVRELVCSLGHKPHRIVELEIGKNGKVARAWRFRWSPVDPVFLLDRKAMRLEVTVSRRRNGRHTRRAVVGIVAVPTVPVRCISVTSPSHLFLAGRSMIPTHNTSFALGIVANAAVNHRVPVLLFSLEMSHLELTQRLLCSEAKVDATRMRNGSLLDSDWGKISTAIGRLGDAPIYIDDNPNITVMDIRAKARRLKASQGLGLVVVDYLQLMSGHARSRAENRQVEVSEISRGLKVLARELDIPVVALSQLSRNLEMRQDKRPVLADLRESGCLTADTRVARADTGVEVTLGELFESGERNISVWALDESLRIVPATMTHVFASGVKPTFELILRSGKRVQASANHPFRTFAGWRRLEDLNVGDRLATPRTMRAPARVSGMVEPGLGLSRLASGASVAILDRSCDRILADPGVCWDEIVAIEARGLAPVYDATVLEHHNFVANGIVAHNSIEQDSDVVMFIYRDEIYHADSADRGKAEIIVAKHRNGPTGVTHLAFVDRHTRFENMSWRQ